MLHTKRDKIIKACVSSGMNYELSSFQDFVDSGISDLPLYQLADWPLVDLSFEYRQGDFQACVLALYHPPWWILCYIIEMITD
jgi:hypothetical protein